VKLPSQQKTIKPYKNAGGTIGGEKYIVHNILFKFAIGKEDLYGDEEAAKVPSLLPHGAAAAWLFPLLITDFWSADCRT